MDINSINSFLNGTDFNSGLRVKVKQEEKLLFNRIQLLGDTVLNKSVLHLGATDHAENIEHKINAGEWLHGVISENADKCVGVDINQAAIEKIAARYNIDNIINWNILEETVPSEIADIDWDYILLGELLEHIDNPVEFLSVLREKLNPIANSVIITVPNAWQYLNCKQALKGVEIINSDHRYYFSPYTICKVATRAGLIPRELTMCEYSDIFKSVDPFSFRRLKKAFKCMFLKHCTILHQCIVLEADLS